MVTTENLDQILFALKNAGVRRARFGDVEFEFEPEVPDDTETAPQTAPAPAVVDTPAPVINGNVIHHSGYAALFKDPPRFRPAEG
jgi:hypothetical protein